MCAGPLSFVTSTESRAITPPNTGSEVFPARFRHACPISRATPSTSGHSPASPSSEPARCIALAHKAHRHLRPQQKHGWIGVDARTLHLQRQVKPLCLQLLEKLHHAMRVEELLSYPGKTWKRDVVVQVRRPFNQ